jgi:hypothetical protein
MKTYVKNVKQLSSLKDYRRQVRKKVELFFHIQIYLIFCILEFAKNHLPLVSPDPIGKLIKQTQLDKSDIEIWGLQYKEPEPSLFFQISQDILLCTCSSTMSSEDFYLFAQTVSSINFSNGRVLYCEIAIFAVHCIRL